MSVREQIISRSILPFETGRRGRRVRCFLVVPDDIYNELKLKYDTILRSVGQKGHSSLVIEMLNMIKSAVDNKTVFVWRPDIGRYQLVTDIVDAKIIGNPTDYTVEFQTEDGQVQTIPLVTNTCSYSLATTER
jgi:hypothetical protein